ncbi:unnamed protein product [Acanthoscelides obtectus]|uniref:Uncharacterized protein n=1 Tax=Acanthoscelides obtectus TaxID=200917 RepID=A0A9P0PBK6_ACAOB|nr:unnamed protein product [Acanthoscelides obtectus]CAK1641903.1 hypothetical protein AOBTE_LOCUS12710 [Acanthoscelides obtectus]
MEQFYLTLNYEGLDYKVCVKDLETANLLLNDAAAAEQYTSILSMCPLGCQHEHNDSKINLRMI